MSSFARLLGASPSVFSIYLDLRLPVSTPDIFPRTKPVTVVWKDDEDLERLVRRVVASVEVAVSELCQDVCYLKLDEVAGGSAFRVELAVESLSPTMHSLELIRVSGSGASEAAVGRLLGVLPLEGVHRVVAGQGFGFFLPVLAPPERWERLMVLNLSGAGFSHLPEVVGSLHQLKELRLSNNKLAALPKAIGNLANLVALAVDHNQLVSIPGELCQCLCLEELNMEANKITTPVLDLKRLPRLKSLQLYDNPLEYLPELSVCTELRSLSFTQLRVWSDKNYSKFEVEISGSSTLSRGAKLAPLFALIFRRSSSQHPLVAGALGQIAEYRENCQSLVRDQGALQQLILMALSEDSIVQLQAAKVIANLLSNSLVAEELVRGDVLRSMLVLMKSGDQEIQLSGLSVISTLALTSDSISLSLLTPDLLEKLQLLITNASVAQVRHLGLEVLGNLGFPAQNKVKMLAVPGLLDLLIGLADGTSELQDSMTKICAKRALAILGQNDEVARIVGRGNVTKRGIRILAMDGGGMKGISTVLLLKELEKRTGQRIFDLFDLIGGTSTGAMLASILGVLNLSLEECGEIYKSLGYKVFNTRHNEDQSSWKESLYRVYRSSQQGMRIAMTGCKHDPSAFERLLQDVCALPEDRCFGDRFIDSACLPCPKIFAVSTLSSIAPAVPFLFRNYEFPPGGDENLCNTRGHVGTSKYNLWQGIRASSAAPYYFDDFHIGDYRFQDGATTANNPAAIAIQQARLLWPNNPIDCVVSIGVGSVPVAKREKSSSTFLENGNVLIESACSVDRVDEILSSVLPMVPEMKYFRFAPVDARCDMALDCVDSDVWERLEGAARDYISSNSAAFDEAALLLSSKIDNLFGDQPSTRQEYLGARKGLLVLEALSPMCEWAQEVSRMCAALPKVIMCKKIGNAVGNMTHKSPGKRVGGSPIVEEASLEYWTGSVNQQRDENEISPRSNGATNVDLMPLSRRLESMLSSGPAGMSREGSESPEAPSVFKCWGQDTANGGRGEGYIQVHSALYASLEEIGVVHLSMSSIEDGMKLVANWETSLLSLVEPSAQVDNMVQLLAEDTLQDSLSAIIEHSPEFWFQGTFYRILSMQETYTPCAQAVRSFVFETYSPSEVIEASDVRSIGSLWKGLLLVSMCQMNDDILHAFLDSKALGIVYLQQPKIPRENAVEFVRSLYKHLWSGCSIPFAFQQAEAMAPALSGAFKLVLR